jgi:DNA-binding GntR family transcriptional regulator
VPEETSEWTSSSASYIGPRDDSAPDPWRQEAARHGRVGGHRLVAVGQQIPPERVAHLLGIETRAPAMLRRRLVTLDDEPVEISDSWYPLEIAASTPLAADAPIRGGAARALADLGFLAARHVEQVAVADVPDDLLELLPHTPVLELTRVSYTATGVPFEVAVMLMTREIEPGVPRRLQYEFESG